MMARETKKTTQMITAEKTAMETSTQTLRSFPAANLWCFSPWETRGFASPFSGSTSPLPPVAPKPAPLPWLSSPLDSSFDMAREG